MVAYRQGAADLCAAYGIASAVHEFGDAVAAKAIASCARAALGSGDAFGHAFDRRDQCREADQREFGLSLVTTAGVVALGSINGILFAVALAIMRFVKHTARPSVELLGEEKGLPGLHSIDRHGAAQAIPGMVLFRFNAPLVFFNADHFKQCALSAAQASGDDLRWFVIDAIPISDIDINGLVVLKDLQQKLLSRNIQLVWAGRQSELLMCLERMGEPTAAVSDLIYPTLRQAVNAYRAL